RAMLRTLRSELPRRYGLQEHYRTKRIQYTCRLLGIPQDIWESAEAAFSSQRQFSADFQAGESGTTEQGRPRYRELREELAVANGGSYRFLPKKQDLADRWEYNGVPPTEG